MQKLKLISQNRLFKKKTINLPIDTTIKPTKNNIKIILYNSIKIYKNKCILELFAGSGIISFDLFDENTIKNTLIENNKRNYINIKNNIYNLHISKNFKTYFESSYTWLKNLKLLNFSIIIADPPYNTQDILIYYNIINKINLIKNFILFFYETSKKLIIKNTFIDYFLIKKYKKGISLCYIIKNI